ncbi:MAG: diguanylate cyclase [Syntrophothermus sp.]
MRERRWLDRENARRTLPFAAAVVVGLIVAALPPAPSTTALALAVALVLGIAVCSAIFPLARPPAPLAVLPPLAFLLAVGLLRGDDGVGSGFGPLALLPVFWIALYGLRWQLVAVIVGVGILFGLPLTGVSGAGYTAADLRYAVTWIVVSALVGFSAQGLVTRERRQRDSLWRQHAFLDAIFAAAGSLVAVLEPDGRVSRVNPACERLSGFAQSEIAGRRFWEALVPSHRAPAMARWWQDIEPAQRAGVYETEMVSRDGSRHLIHWTLEALRGPGGDVVNFVATGLDVSGQRRAEAALAESEFRLRTLISNLPDTFISFYDRDLRCLAVEGPRLEERGIWPREFVGRRLDEALGAIDAAPLTAAMRSALAGAPTHLEYEARRSDAIYEVEVVPYERHGSVEGVFIVARDVTQRKRFERELKHLAEHDPLTGLLNRRRFETELPRHLARIARYGRGGALLLLDVDRLKAVNDTFGHARGDELILLVARILDRELRAGDLAARLGGDEFAVLLPEADGAEAEAVAAKLVDAVRERNLTANGAPSQPVTVSVGAVSLGDEAHLSADQLVAEADLAMYEAKAAGGDGFRVHRLEAQRLA